VTRIYLATCVLASSLLSSGAVAAQDAAAGEKVFRKCASCHQVGDKAKRGAGPILNGIIGAAAAQRDDFKYSPALSESGLTWDEATLADYLANPKSVVPKTRMAFAGLKDPDQIADVIAFLATWNADGTQN
jgi:cytochrome c